MKKTLLTAMLVGCGVIVFAQSDKEEVDLVQSAFGMEKKAMVAEFVDLEGVQKDAFWVMYDEYETKRKELGKKRIDLLSRYADGYATLDDESTDQITKEIISLQEKNNKLISTYYNKMKKGSGVKAAAQFYQFENYILGKIRSEIMESIPFIGEFDDK